MNSFDRYAHTEPTYAEYEYLDNLHARREEAAIETRDRAWEFQEQNWIECPEFARKQPARGQMELFSEEVA